MPNVQNRLCNSTPFPVKINWHAGINIIVPSDNYVDLTIEQMDDFREGKPGSEAVREVMHHSGIFLRDADRTYESQALEAIKLSLRSKKSQYDGVVNNLRRSRAQNGITENAEAFEEILASMGYVALRGEIELLQSRSKFLSQHVEVAEAVVHQSFDPERTLVFLDPPREFPSVVAMQMFLNENPDMQKQRDEYLSALKEAEDEAGSREV